MKQIRIALVGDYNERHLAHRAIPHALEISASAANCSVEPVWRDTVQWETEPMEPFDAFWCVPASPYRSMQGALRAIQFARENRRPFLGTCGGFQHALIEYARNVLKLSDADHTESNPGAKMPIISKLSCALVNQSETIRIYPGTRLAEIYGSKKAVESYQCSYGFNPELRKHFESAPMQFTTPLHFTAFN